MKAPLVALSLALPLTTAVAGEPAASANSSAENSWLDAYNIAWNEPGAKVLHSMPCGDGNIALNVWTTKDDLLFHIALPDSRNGMTGEGPVATGSSETETQGVRTAAFGLTTTRPVRSFGLKGTLRIAQDPSLDVWQHEPAAFEARGRTISADKAIMLEPIKVLHIRLSILKAVGPININECQVFSPVNDAL